MFLAGQQPHPRIRLGHLQWRHAAHGTIVVHCREGPKVQQDATALPGRAAFFFFGNGEVIGCGKNGVEWGSLSWAFVRALGKLKVLSAKMRNDVQNVLTPLANKQSPHKSKRE